MTHSFIWHESEREQVLQALQLALLNVGISPQNLETVLKWAFGDNWANQPIFLLPMRWNFLNETLERGNDPLFITHYMEEAASIIFNAISQRDTLEIPNYALLDMKMRNPKFLEPPERRRYENHKAYERRIKYERQKALDKIYKSS